MKPSISITACLALLLLHSSIGKPLSGSALQYQTGYSTLAELGKEMHKRLPAHARALVSPEPVSLDSSEAPFIHLLVKREGNHEIRGLWVSLGFIDLLNQLSHAKAIDTVERGYFRSYLQMLSMNNLGGGVQALPKIDKKAYWEDDVINEQRSNFISLGGLVLGIELSHLYSGICDKYRSQAVDAPGAAAMNSIVSSEEWDKAFLSGTWSALRAGCMVDGVIPFLEGMAQLKSRPTWVSCFLPADIKVARLKKELKKAQSAFFTRGD